MKVSLLALTRSTAAAAIALASSCAMADTQTVVQSSSFGMLTLPYTTNFGQSLAPMAADDTFLSDYGFSIGANGSFTSAVVTIDLGNTFDISNMTVSLLQGSAWAGPVPSDLTASQIADRDSRIIVTGSGSSMTQAIDEVPLGPGNYVVEISGNVTGTNGGTYAGLLNVAAVPEPAGFALALAGFGLLALARRRTGR